MIRPATLSDLRPLLALLMEMHQGSKYPAMDVGVSEPVAKALLRDCLVRNGRTNDGGTLVNVVDVDGEIAGFMVGILQRVYLIGNRLEAQDMWLHCTSKAPRGSAGKLIDAYVAWAEGNPKVAEISLTWTDAMSSRGSAIGSLYQRKGFAKRGETWGRAGV